MKKIAFLLFVLMLSLVTACGVEKETSTDMQPVAEERVAAEDDSLREDATMKTFLELAQGWWVELEDNKQLLKIDGNIFCQGYYQSEMGREGTITKVEYVDGSYDVTICFPETIMYGTEKLLEKEMAISVYLDTSGNNGANGMTIINYEDKSLVEYQFAGETIDDVSVMIEQEETQQDGQYDIPYVSKTCLLGSTFEELQIRGVARYKIDAPAHTIPKIQTSVDSTIQYYAVESNTFVGMKDGCAVAFVSYFGIDYRVSHILQTNIKEFYEKTPMISLNGSENNRRADLCWKLDNGYMIIDAVPMEGLSWYEYPVGYLTYVENLDLYALA